MSDEFIGPVNHPGIPISTLMKHDRERKRARELEKINLYNEVIRRIYVKEANLTPEYAAKLALYLEDRKKPRDQRRYV